MGLAEELESLAPFGRGNPRVLAAARGRELRRRQADGGGQARALQRQLRRRSARAVAFGSDGRLPVADGEPVQATFTLEVNEWNGVSEPRLVLRRARAAEQPAADHPAAAGAARRRARQQELALFAV